MKTGFICASGYNVVASATRNGRRLIAIVLGAWSGAVRAQKAAQLLERGFNSGGLSWLTPSLGTVDALAPIDAQPPNLREEMCGGHRRKPPSEDNNEEEEPDDGRRRPAPVKRAGSAQAFMLSSLKPANGKFVLGPAGRNRAAGRGVHRPGQSSRSGADRQRAVAQEAQEGRSTSTKQKRTSRQATTRRRKTRAKTTSRQSKTAKPKVSSAAQ